MVAQVAGHQVAVGNAKLLTNHQIDLVAVAQTAPAWAGEGALPGYVAIDGQLRGLLGISDPLKD